MKYFIDTEFLEGTQKKTVFGIHYGETKPTIDLISIGIVAEDGREYYAISKDFNLKEAWNRFQMKETSPAKKYIGVFEEKEYWIRDNVLKPIFYELIGKDINFHEYDLHFTYKSFKFLILKYGKTNKQIANEISIFTKTYSKDSYNIWDKPEFYGYYADYDWVAFCWLFGKMVNLPDGFPMYCKDLKQLLDEELEKANFINAPKLVAYKNSIEYHPNYPKLTNEHNALADARWNKALYEFINTL